MTQVMMRCDVASLAKSPSRHGKEVFSCLLVS
jgi:hypothetical protein